MPEQIAAVKAIILARLRARNEHENKQRKLFNENDGFHEQIRQKLSGLWDVPQFWNFTRCGAEDFFRTCKSCSAVEKFKYRCSIKWCPRCQWKITAERKRVLELWSSRVRQPKHLVLTIKNFDVLSG